MLMFLLPLTALLVIFVKNVWSYEAKSQPLTLKNVSMALLTGMIIGLYDSLYGPGGGTIALLLFTLLLRYDVRTSSGNAKMVLIVSNYTALFSYLLSGNVLFVIAVPCAVCNVLGNYIGAGFAVKKGAKLIRPIMIGVVAVLIIKIISGR